MNGQRNTFSSHEQSDMGNLWEKEEGSLGIQDKNKKINIEEKIVTT